MTFTHGFAKCVNLLTTTGAKVAKEHIRAKLKGLLKLVYEHRQEIADIAKEHIPDFHFLDDRVKECSYGFFWDCEESPIGVCVFRLDDYGRETSCRYCGGPVERK